MSGDGAHTVQRCHTPYVGVHDSSDEEALSPTLPKEEK